MFVTVELLEDLKACDRQRTLFAKMFPRGVELTRELIVQHAQDFDWLWCAEHLAGDVEYAVYLQAERSAWDAYSRAIAPALAIYWQADEQAEAAYDQAMEQAEAVYQQAVESAEAAYNLTRATAFADAMGL